MCCRALSAYFKQIGCLKGKCLNVCFRCKGTLKLGPAAFLCILETDYGGKFTFGKPVKVTKEQRPGPEMKSRNYLRQEGGLGLHPIFSLCKNQTLLGQRA